MDDLRCCRCQCQPHEIEDVREMAKDFELSPADFVRQEEGTYNDALGLFTCMSCYLALGMPSSTEGWKPSRVYALDEKPGKGPAGIPGSPLRAFQDELLASLERSKK